MYTFTDCIGFGGAFALGMTQAGFQLKAKREIMKFGVQACEANRQTLGWAFDTQVAKLTRWPDWEIEHTDVVTGNPPCSGFSTMTRADLRGVDAAINDCMWAFASYVARSAPTIAAFESVQSAYKLGQPLMQNLRAMVEEKTGKKYHLTHLYHNALDTGGPANRPRYFWVVSEIPFGVEIPEPDLVPTNNEVFGDLRGLEETWEKQPYRRPENWWSHRRRSLDGAVDGHMTRRLTEYVRINDLFDAMDGEWPQGWRCEDMLRACYARHGALPPSWASQEDRLSKRNFEMGVNQPMRWYDHKPPRVITGAAMSVVVHPHENRLLTHREAARIQGFPDTWRLWPLRDVKNLYRTHGKGIPVDAGRWLGYWIKQALDGNPGTMIGQPVGPERETLIRADRGFVKAQDRGRRRHEFWAA